MLRCAASLVIAAYVKVRLIPRDLRALPPEHFTALSKKWYGVSRTIHGE
jgi:hypothetical protein